MGTELTADNKLKRLIIVGDRLLVKPKKESEKTDSGIYLPPGVREKEKIQSGYVVKAGPGYPIPLPADEDEAWKPDNEPIKYIPLQAQEGDLAVFLQKGAIEVLLEGVKHYIVPQSAILMLEREEDLFD